MDGFFFTKASDGTPGAVAAECEPAQDDCLDHEDQFGGRESNSSLVHPPLHPLADILTPSIDRVGVWTTFCCLVLFWCGFA